MFDISIIYIVFITFLQSRAPCAAPCHISRADLFFRNLDAVLSFLGFLDFQISSRTGNWLDLRYPPGCNQVDGLPLVAHTHAKARTPQPGP